MRPGTRLPGARPHDRARPGLRPRLFHLRPPAPLGALPYSGTWQVLPGACGERDVPLRAPPHHRAPELGCPHPAANPRPRGLHCALPPWPARHRQSLGPDLLHLRAQRPGQLLRGPQQDPRPLRLPRGEPRGLQVQGPAVLDAGADVHPARQHSEARAGGLQRGPAPEASRLELRDPALRVSGLGPGRPGHLTGPDRSLKASRASHEPASCPSVLRRRRGGGEGTLGDRTRRTPRALRVPEVRAPRSLREWPDSRGPRPRQSEKSARRRGSEPAPRRIRDGRGQGRRTAEVGPGPRREAERRASDAGGRRRHGY